MLYRLIFYTLIILLSNTGCNSHNDAPVLDNRISFVSNEEKGTKNRASSTSFFQEGDAFGVFGSYYTDLAKQTHEFSNEPVILKGNKWDYLVPRFWRKGKRYRFRAIYPYADQTAANPTYVVSNTFGKNNKCEIANFIVEDNVAQQVDLLVSDVVERDLTAPDVQLLPQPAVVFTFQHLLTRVGVKLKLDTKAFHDMAQANGYTQMKVTKLSAQLYGMKTKGTFKRAKRDEWITNYSEPNQVGFFKAYQNEQDNLFGTDGSKVITVWGTAPAGGTSGSTSTEDGLLMIPQDVTGIYLRVDFLLYYNDAQGKPAHMKADNVQSVPVSTPWGIGKQIMYTATLDPTLKIKFLAPKVEPWSVAQNSNSVIIK